MKKKKLVGSSTPFTDWVKNGAKEEEWEEFLRDQEKKESREACRIRDGLLKKLKESGMEWEDFFRGIRFQIYIAESNNTTSWNEEAISRWECAR